MQLFEVPERGGGMGSGLKGGNGEERRLLGKKGKGGKERKEARGGDEEGEG